MRVDAKDLLNDHDSASRRRRARLIGAEFKSIWQVIVVLAIVVSLGFVNGRGCRGALIVTKVRVE